MKAGQELNYSHVLISRPGPEAARLAQMLELLGLVALQIPAFRFEPGYPGLDFSLAWPDEGRRLAIFSSPRSVEFGLRQLPAGFLDGVEIAAIGPATSNVLEAAGYSVSIVPRDEFNSEALLRHEALNRQPGKAILFAAPGGRDHLFRGLKESGWAVEFAHVYRSVPLEAEAADIEVIRHSRALASIWTSANALQQLSVSLGPEAWEKVCEGAFIVTSKRLQKLAQDHARGPVYVTDGPGNEAIKDCIVQLI